MSDRFRHLCLRFAAVFLILWTPFFSFSADHGHPVPISSLIYSASLFAGPAFLLALLAGHERRYRYVGVFALLSLAFLDLQFDWMRGISAFITAVLIVAAFWAMRGRLALTLTTVFSTILVFTAVAPRPEDSDIKFEEGRGTTTQTAKGQDSRMDTFVYILLDEFIGVEGIPEEVQGGLALRNQITQLFEKNGFVLYPQAFSEYARSKYSIPSILNLEATAEPQRNIRSERPYVLKRNHVFEVLSQRYAELHVTQSTYIDFCEESPTPITSCFTYSFEGSDWLRSAALDDKDKLNILFGIYFNQQGLFEFGRNGYFRLRNGAASLGFELPRGIVWDGRVTPIASVNAFDHFQKTVLESDRGTAHFGHIDLPHGPYVMDANCNLKGNPFGWLSHRPLNVLENTAEGRQIRYAQYFDQVRCTLNRLDRLFTLLKDTGKWRNSTIVIHGDHGSRIYQTLVSGENKATLTRSDLLDGFSTLFAVRSNAARRLDPSAVPKINTNPRRPVSQLLAEALEIEFPESDQATVPRVYLEGDAGWLPLPWNPNSASAQSPRDSEAPE